MLVSILAGLAALMPYTEEFSFSSGIDGWAKIQATPDTLVQWHSSGYMLMNIQDNIVGNESIGYMLDGVLQGTEKVEVSVRLVNSHNNYYRAHVQLWNATDNVLLAESEEVLVYGLNGVDYVPVDVYVSCTAGFDDAGKEVQVRIKDACNGSQRDIIVDRVSVNISPSYHKYIYELGAAMPTVNVRSSDFGYLPDGREVAFSVSNGEPVTFNVLDLHTGERIHSVAVSGEMVAGTAYQSADGSVYFNVSQSTPAALYRYTPGDQALSCIGERIEGQLWLHDIISDPNGILYMASYPKAKLLSYNPYTGAIRNYGSVVSDAAYAYSVEIVNNKIWVGTGPVAHLIVVDPISGAMQEMQIPSMFVANADYITKLEKRGNRVFARFTPKGEFDAAVYDLRTQEWSHVPTGIAGSGVTESDGNGTVYYLSNRKLYSFNLDTGEINEETGILSTPAGNALRGSQTIYDIELMEIDGKKAVVGMTTTGNLWRYFPAEGTGDTMQGEIQASNAKVVGFGVGPDGKVYAGAKIGVGTMARIDPSTHGIEELSGPSQAEGVGGKGDTILIGDYSGAGLNMGDLSKPWSWGTNPRQVFRLGRGAPYYQDRIWAIETVGDQFALATIPDPGENGGSLTFFDPVTGGYEVHRHVVTNQSLIDLSFRDGLLYGATSIHGGTGSPKLAADACLFIWDMAEGKKIWEGVPIPGAPVINGLTWTPDGLLWGITERGAVFEFDPQSRQVLRSKLIKYPPGIHPWGNACSLIYDERTDSFAGTVGQCVFILDRESMSFHILETAHEILRLVRAGNGSIYGTDETHLYLIKLRP